jgi:superfamily II DNA or RNA helicase
MKSKLRFFIDKTNPGKSIKVEFNGQLRDEQSLALEQMLQNHTGILSGTTAFGKTVVGIKLIAERKINTLILVDKISLLSQWKEKLKEFLIFNETLPDTGKKRGRKRSIVGQLGSGKNTLNGIVDVAVMQSISRQGEVKDCVNDYGMIIADECHHVSAVNYENILKLQMQDIYTVYPLLQIERMATTLFSLCNAVLFDIVMMLKNRLIKGRSIIILFQDLHPSERQ